jgi:transcriptional regulator with XRE-family HTH domain
MDDKGRGSGGNSLKLTPKHLTKQEFGNRLYKLMMAKGWRQSDLARQAGLNRDSISTYIRGTSLPTPQNLQELARAFGMKPEELLPNHSIAAINEDVPAFEMKMSAFAPDKVMLRVNRLVTMATAVQIAQLLQADNTTEGA